MLRLAHISINRRRLAPQHRILKPKKKCFGDTNIGIRTTTKVSLTALHAAMSVLSTDGFFFPHNITSCFGFVFQLFLLVFASNSLKSDCLRPCLEILFSQTFLQILADSSPWFIRSIGIFGAHNVGIETASNPPWEKSFRFENESENSIHFSATASAINFDCLCAARVAATICVN